MTDSGNLTHHFAFDQPNQTKVEGGKVETTWAKAHEDLVQIIYSRGSEVVEAARLQGRPIYKVRFRTCGPALLITTDWRARDVRRNVIYSIREIDSLTDPLWTYAVIEGEKAP